MAKRRSSGKVPQPQFKQNRTPSRHDRRERLSQPNPDRVATMRASVPLIGSMSLIVAMMQRSLDTRTAFRFSILFAGMVLAKGRRTVSSWFRGAGVRDDWEKFYEALQSVGKYPKSLMKPLLKAIVDRFSSTDSECLRIGIDDSPTNRFGKHVEGASIHHNPTPGPGDHEWLYGHNWVTAAILMPHSLWGTIALPIQAVMYVRKTSMDVLSAKHGLVFRTKIEIAIDMATQIIKNVRYQGCKVAIQLVVDGAYATRDVLTAMKELNVTVLSRLRSNSCLYDLPTPTSSGKRGRPPKYGKNKISLTELAKCNSDWETIEIVSRGQKVQRQVKSFVATSRVAGGPIRVVIVKYENDRWAAYFSSDPNLDAKSILEGIADRWAIEEVFHDVKEVWHAGKQQVRNLWSNIACWNMNCWAYTLVELECWDTPKAELVDRNSSPWDNSSRRPSHADRCRSIRAKMLAERFKVEMGLDPMHTKIKPLFDELLALAS
jgi:hypothetical protein